MSPEFEQFFEEFEVAIRKLTFEGKDEFWQAFYEWYWQHEEDRDVIIRALNKIFYVSGYDVDGEEE